jgi:hypothetical protein
VQTIDTVNGVCSTPSACAGILGESCTSAADATQAEADACSAADLADAAADPWQNAEAGEHNCKAAGQCTYSLYAGREYGGQTVAVSCAAAARDAGACCDQDIRNYYSTSTATQGAV